MRHTFATHLLESAADARRAKTGRHQNDKQYAEPARSAPPGGRATGLSGGRGSGSGGGGYLPPPSTSPRAIWCGSSRPALKRCRFSTPGRESCRHANSKCGVFGRMSTAPRRSPQASPPWRSVTTSARRSSRVRRAAHHGRHHSASTASTRLMRGRARSASAAASSSAAGSVLRSRSVSASCKARTDARIALAVRVSAASRRWCAGFFSAPW